MFNYSSAFLENNETAANETNLFSSPSYIMESFGVKVTFFFFYVVIFLFGCSSNVVMLVVGIRHQILGHKLNLFARGGKEAGQEIAFSVTNVLVTNLAAADLLLCAFSLFFTPISFYIDEWPFGEFGCKFLPSTSIISVCVISFTSTIIAVDRLLAICYPHSPRLTVRSALVFLVFLWAISAGCSLPVVLHSTTEFNEDLMVIRCVEMWSSDVHRKMFSSGILIVQFFIPAIIISCCYVRIGLQIKARNHLHGNNNNFAKSKIAKIWLKANENVDNKNNNNSNSPSPNRSNNLSALISEDRKTLRTIRILIAMVVIFMFCWLPINVLLLYADVSEENVWQSTAWYAPAYFTGHIVAMLCTLFNPLLYGWMNGKLRLKIMETFFPKNNNNKDRNSFLLPLREITDQNRRVVEHLLSPAASKQAENNENSTNFQNSKPRENGKIVNKPVSNAFDNPVEKNVITVTVIEDL